MSHDNEKRPEALSSAEYRAKLMTKLNCLIAVLEVAIAKISKSMDLPGANEERLLKIQSNLENTLSICKRAKGTLERSMAQGGESTESMQRPGEMSARDYVELSSIDEYRKFKTLPPISSDDLSDVNFDDLAKKLFDA